MTERESRALPRLLWPAVVVEAACVGAFVYFTWRIYAVNHAPGTGPIETSVALAHALTAVGFATKAILALYVFAGAWIVSIVVLAYRYRSRLLHLSPWCPAAAAVWVPILVYGFLLWSWTAI